MNALLTEPGRFFFAYGDWYWILPGPGRVFPDLDLFPGESLALPAFKWQENNWDPTGTSAVLP